jgi:hypothetical protein
LPLIKAIARHDDMPPHDSELAEQSVEALYHQHNPKRKDTL